METGFEYVSLETLDKELQKKVNIFRRNTSIISGNTRTDAELKIHNDKYCSDKDIKKWILVMDSGEIIGLGAVFLRTIKYLDWLVKLGGVGKIRVAEEYRKKGIASRIMSIAMEQLNETGADVALLCTNTKSFLVDFYRKYGFELLSKPYRFTGKSGKKYIDEEGMLAPIKSNEICILIRQAEELLNIGVGNW